tara:strand:- start:7260 stop:7577 length:318 start_codon:yes stop_codon:yes gene_type:complete
MEIYGIQLELWLGLGVGVLAAAVWGLKKYKQVSADGKLTIDEILDIADDVEDIVDDIEAKTKEMKKQYNAKKKAELIALCEEKGLDTTGTKADLIARLAELVVEE